MYSRNRKSLAVITPQSAAVPLISLAEMKAFMRVDTAADDSLIEDFVKTATDVISQYLQRSIISQTLELTMDRFNDSFDPVDALGDGVHEVPSNFGSGCLFIDLPFPPTISVTTIKTTDQANAQTTLSSAAYTVDANAGRILLNTGYSWPTALRDRSAVAIRYIAGWGYTSVPMPVRQAVRQYAAAMYDCRRMCELSPEVISMLAPYRLLDNRGFY